MTLTSLKKKNIFSRKTKLITKQFTRVLIHFSALCALMLLPLTLPATTQESPDSLINHTIHSLLDQFTSKQELYTTDAQELFKLVERVIIPLFDLKIMTKSALDIEWEQINLKQRHNFTLKFKNLLIDVYTKALLKYTKTENKVLTFKKAITKTTRKGFKIAKVTSFISLHNNDSPTLIIYKLFLNKNGHWKIYDLTTSGFSINYLYRNTYIFDINEYSENIINSN